MDKFQRVYSLKVEVDDGANQSPLTTAYLSKFGANKNVEITLPYTLEFSISRAAFSSAQTGTFRVYNLSEPVRNAIQKDIFQFEQLRAIQLRAGYESQPAGSFMPLVFNGTVITAYSWREGRDWVTEIEAFDGGWQMANANTVSITLTPGQSAASVVRQLCSQMPALTGTPFIGNFPTTNKRGEVLSGNAWDLILQKTNGHATIDNGQVKALNYWEVLQGEVQVISSDAGLLGSPKRTTSTLEFEMIFEPRLTVGQVVELQSVTNKQYNRSWKVLGFDHRGVISPSTSGECLTSVRLWFTPEKFQIVAGGLAA